jgi:aryl-alcohol dehydrogenase-like predicted oxidoreductase
MQTRRLGRTNHYSTVAIFGGFTLYNADQEQADGIMAHVIKAGINHIDVAPSYGNAEKRLGPWMAKMRAHFFLGCTTWKRDYDSAKAELHQSLELLQTDTFDLYQLHAITNVDELDQVTKPGGALEAIIEAREEGLTKYIGITGHGNYTAAVFMEALERFDFDTVMLPLNFIQYAIPEYQRDTQTLLALCKARDIGVVVIKAVAKAPWGNREPHYNSWYEPFTEPEMIQKGVNFVLSQDVTGLCPPGEGKLLPSVIEACLNFTHLNNQEQESLIGTASQYASVFESDKQLFPTR